MREYSDGWPYLEGPGSDGNKKCPCGRKRTTVDKLDKIAGLAAELFKIVLDGDPESDWFYYDDKKDMFVFSGWSNRHNAEFYKETRLKGMGMEECARAAFSPILNFKPPRLDERGDPTE